MFSKVVPKEVTLELNLDEQESMAGKQVQLTKLSLQGKKKREKRETGKKNKHSNLSKDPEMGSGGKFSHGLFFPKVVHPFHDKTSPH